MKHFKQILFSFVSAIVVGLCLSYRLKIQVTKEMETIKTNSDCGKGEIYNRISKRCEAPKFTIVENPDKPLTFNQTFISPKIVDLLPIFKYEDEKNKE